jgi:hypothetical protein
LPDRNDVPGPAMSTQCQLRHIAMSHGEVNTTLSLKERLIGCWHWPKYRLLGECWAMECPIPSRLNVLHGPWQLRRCENTPMAISITEQGMARIVIAEAEDLIA